MDLATGYLMVLPRDDAKQFFGHRQDEPRLAFLRDLLANDQIARQELNGRWEVIQQALANIDMEKSFLPQAILGGRPLHQGDDYHVCLVRPDVVGFIADQLNQVDSTSLDTLAEDVAKVHAIYQTAAQAGAAMVFVAEKS